MPVDTTTIRTLYIFVEIGIDATHLVQTIRSNFPPSKQELLQTHLIEDAKPIEGATLQIESSETAQSGSDVVTPTKAKYALVSTIQFVASLQKLHDDLSVEQPASSAPPSSGLITDSESMGLGPSNARYHFSSYDTVIPRSKPLSPGEILGCTAPRLSPDVDALM